MRIIVTGSSGTIGTRLCEKLLANGHDVIGVDVKKNEWSSQVNDSTIILDLRDGNKVTELLPSRVDLLIHLAANARVHDLVANPTLARDNFEILFNTLEYVRKSGVRKFMFSSSREVYGNTDKIVSSEDQAFSKNCESPYTASKLAGEALIHSYQKCYGIDFCILRFSNVFGMYDRSNRIIPLYIQKCLQNNSIIVYGEDKILDFTYIDDTVNGVIKLMGNFDKVKNEVYNLSTGVGTTLMELASMVKKLTNSESKVYLKDTRTGEVVKYIADISKVREKVGYIPRYSLDEGVSRTVNWYRTHLYCLPISRIEYKKKDDINIKKYL